MVVLDAESLADLKILYQQSAEEIKRRIASYAGADGNIPLYQLQDLLRQVNARLEVLSGVRNTMLTRDLIEAAALGTQPFTAAGLGLTAEATLSSFAATKINDAAVSFVRTFVADNGLQLSDRLWRLDRHAREIMGNAIESAVIQGHGAAEAAREFLARGEAVPVEVQNKISAANADGVAKMATGALFTGSGSPMDNAMRVFRTELNRAHGVAYAQGFMEHPDAAGLRFKLSPAHPQHDICDLLSTQNLHGLGPGVYPTLEKTGWPAHPNTISFLEGVFKDEITDADRAGKETPIEALGRLTPAQRVGVLGVKKNDIFNQGKLTQGMIKAPVKAVQKRVGASPASAQVKPPPAAAKNLDLNGMLQAGNKLTGDLLKAVEVEAGVYDVPVLLANIHAALKKARPVMKEAKLESSGKGATYVKAASQMYPDDWTSEVDKYGPLYAKYSQSRGFQISLMPSAAGRYYRIMGQKGTAKGGEGFLQVDSFSTAVHEYGHRIQHVLPELDDYFQQLHGKRTNGDPLKRLRDLRPGSSYGRSEVTREDSYRNVYQGRIYSNMSYLGRHGALEVLTMAFEDVLGGDPQRLYQLIYKDREMFDLVVGLLFNYKP